MPKEKNKVEKSDELVIDLSSVAMPAAIVIAGLIIAGAIFFTNREKGVAGTDTSQNGNVAEEEFPTAKTSIGDSPYLGDKGKAKVAIVEFTDYQCPYCEKHAEQTKPALIKDYVDTGEAIYVVRNFPLDFHGQIAIDTANAGLCVFELGGNQKFFEYYDKAYLQTSTTDLANIAQGLGVNMDSYNTCMTEGRYVDTINADTAEGANAGVQGTPGFIVGTLDKDGNVTGKLIAGAYPYDAFKAILDEYLK